jgi:hypothetical protein
MNDNADVYDDLVDAEHMPEVKKLPRELGEIPLFAHLKCTWLAPLLARVCSRSAQLRGNPCADLGTNAEHVCVAVPEPKWSPPPNMRLQVGGALVDVFRPTMKQGYVIRRRVHRQALSYDKQKILASIQKAPAGFLTQDDYRLLKESQHVKRLRALSSSQESILDPRIVLESQDDDDVAEADDKNELLVAKRQRAHSTGTIDSQAPVDEDEDDDEGDYHFGGGGEDDDDGDSGDGGGGS